MEIIPGDIVSYLRNSGTAVKNPLMKETGVLCLLVGRNGTHAGQKIDA